MGLRIELAPEVPAQPKPEAGTSQARDQSDGTRRLPQVKRSGQAQNAG
ncbi:hypothetical protein ACFO25_03370 [Paenactinomyces guangxiensis]|uniref:Uncharacterized protein n=1 Tax=Paenactinomyces guangxiensis TaxID=1490290 RepID=A0A7W1WRU9_9BACL|nr:hypothetical protein [Paenactinomyces guangxiensis]MBA4494804.1 hypothetical protein [Paenactinomyces guangxiensis]MBH8591887.1 hypothetical protein [Paenactinomyces guangxiensis]